MNDPDCHWGKGKRTSQKNNTLQGKGGAGQTPLSIQFILAEKIELVGEEFVAPKRKSIQK